MPFLTLSFLVGRSPTKIDKTEKNGTLMLSKLEDLALLFGPFGFSLPFLGAHLVAIMIQQ